MIVRQFLSWIRTAPARERAEATRALARAYLFSAMSEGDRAAAEGALLMLLDDASTLVREAIAQVFASRADAPAEIVRALAADQASVAIPILEFSPLLIDADLVDLAATADVDKQCAIARRQALPASVAAAIAEVGSAAACLELVENPQAHIAPFSLDRIISRHGHLAALREALLERQDLSAAMRLTLAQKLAETLSQLALARRWIDPDQAARLLDDNQDHATLEAAAGLRDEAMAAMVRHLRQASLLTPALILRALLCGNESFLTAALVELAGLSPSRVASLIADRGASSLPALLGRAGLPASLVPAFRAALEAVREVGFAYSQGGQAVLNRRMVERVMTGCADCVGASDPLMILLRRFATEAAREEARVLCGDLVFEDDCRAADISADDAAWDDEAGWPRIAA